MSSFESNPGDLDPEDDEGYSYDEELVEEILYMIDQGYPVRLFFINSNANPEKFREFVEVMRDAGAEVIIPTDN